MGAGTMMSRGGVMSSKVMHRLLRRRAGCCRRNESRRKQKGRGKNDKLEETLLHQSQTALSIASVKNP
jgi:hypothetical protein